MRNGPYWLNIGSILYQYGCATTEEEIVVVYLLIVPVKGAGSSSRRYRNVDHFFTLRIFVIHPCLAGMRSSCYRKLQ